MWCLHQNGGVYHNADSHEPCDVFIKMVGPHRHCAHYIITANTPAAWAVKRGWVSTTCKDLHAPLASLNTSAPWGPQWQLNQDTLNLHAAKNKPQHRASPECTHQHMLPMPWCRTLKVPWGCCGTWLSTKQAHPSRWRSMATWGSG